MNFLLFFDKLDLSNDLEKEELSKDSNNGRMEMIHWQPIKKLVSNNWFLKKVFAKFRDGIQTEASVTTTKLKRIIDGRKESIMNYKLRLNCLF